LNAPQAPQHFLCFFPLPHGQGSFRPTLGVSRLTVADGRWPIYRLYRCWSCFCLPATNSAKSGISARSASIIAPMEGAPVVTEVARRSHVSLRPNAPRQSTVSARFWLNFMTCVHRFHIPQPPRRKRRSTIHRSPTVATFHFHFSPLPSLRHQDRNHPPPAVPIQSKMAVQCEDAVAFPSFDHGDAPANRFPASSITPRQKVRQ
jgi:hypothetical protein